LARISGTQIIGSMAPPYLFLSHPSYSSSIHPFFPITFQVVLRQSKAGSPGWLQGGHPEFQPPYKGHPQTTRYAGGS
jgi:hypothetical protein